MSENSYNVGCHLLICPIPFSVLFSVFKSREKQRLLSLSGLPYHEYLVPFFGSPNVCNWLCSWQNIVLSPDIWTTGKSFSWAIWVNTITVLTSRKSARKGKFDMPAIKTLNSRWIIVWLTLNSRWIICLSFSEKKTIKLLTRMESDHSITRPIAKSRVP